MIVREGKATSHRSTKKDSIPKPLEPPEATIEEKEEESASTSYASFRVAIP
jgi:hypothetical protein